MNINLVHKIVISRKNLILLNISKKALNINI